jgi:hypothetical protein
MVCEELLEVFEVVALGRNLIGLDERLGLVLLGDILAFGRVKGSQIRVGDPSAIEETISKQLASGVDYVRVPTYNS